MRRRRRRGPVWPWGVMLCTILFLAGFWFFRVRYGPVVEELAETQAKITASDLINDAIAAQIDNENIQYDRIVYFEKDLNGKITALKTNMTEINRLRAQILDEISRSVLNLGPQDIGVPIGSVLLPELLSGKGPRISVRVLSASNSDAKFVSTFSEAGINQTLQQLTVNVSMDVTILVMNRMETVTATGQMVVAETVIVGTVPNTFIDGRALGNLGG